MGWECWLNAEIYDRFVRERGVYRWLNAHLVELARLHGARRVLDLGCGTGATTRSCMALLGPEATIVGVDASAAMIEVARANEIDPRARYLVCDAAAVDQVTEGPFDRVVCNAAFWQFPDSAPVFDSISRVASTGARLVFDVPASQVVGESHRLHPFQVCLALEIEQATGHPFQRRAAVVDPDHLEQQASSTGWELVEVHRLAYQGQQGELVDLMTIPAMSDSLMPGLPPDQRREVVRRAAEAVDRSEPIHSPWVYFVLERRAR